MPPCMITDGAAIDAFPVVLPIDDDKNASRRRHARYADRAAALARLRLMTSPLRYASLTRNYLELGHPMVPKGLPKPVVR